MPDFYDSSYEYSYQKDGTVQIIFATALYCSRSYCFPYGFTGPAQRFTSNFSSPYGSSTSYGSYGMTSVRMNFIHLLISGYSTIEIVQLTNDIDKAPAAFDIEEIENIAGLSIRKGCAVRFTDYSFLYIGGDKAVEVEIINNSYKELPGTLNHNREHFGCDVVVIDGVETVLVAGGKGSEASKTSEYYDRNAKSWVLTPGGLIYPR